VIVRGVKQEGEGNKNPREKDHLKAMLCWRKGASNRTGEDDSGQGGVWSTKDK